MKKFIAIALGLSMTLALVACGNDNGASTDATVTEAPTETEATPEATGDVAVMSHADFDAAALDSQVTVETYVQAKQSWWDNKATVYTQAEDGAYFLYDMACSEDDYAKLTPGTKIRVTGFKSEWSGEVEITDASFEILDGSYTAVPTDVTDLLGDETALAAHMNELVSFTGLTVAPSTDAEGNEAAYLYSWDGSGSHDANSDLYFNVMAADGTTYNFTVESYLCDNSTEVYAAVETLQVGDVVDIEAFLYWYNGANPHTTSIAITPATNDVMSYAEYIAADIDTPVVVETYVQDKQSWWDNTANVYAQSEDGAYFIYNMACSEDDYALLDAGTKIRVTGYKSEWSGEVEITDATFEIIEPVSESSYWAAEHIVDVTDLLADEAALSEHMNQFVSFTDMEIVASTDADGNEAAFLYSWDGSGSHDGNSDLYFNAVTADGTSVNFTVESYLCDNTTDIYAAVESLLVGDKVDLCGYLYWYNGANPHITGLIVK